MLQWANKMWVRGEEIEIKTRGRNSLTENERERRCVREMLVMIISLPARAVKER